MIDPRRDGAAEVQARTPAASGRVRWRAGPPALQILSGAALSTNNGAEAVSTSSGALRLDRRGWNGGKPGCIRPSSACGEKIGAARLVDALVRLSRREPACKSSLPYGPGSGALSFLSRKPRSRAPPRPPLRPGPSRMRALPIPRPQRNPVFRADRHAAASARAPGLLFAELKKKRSLMRSFSFCGRIAPPHRATCGRLCTPAISASRRGLHDIETDFLIYGIELGGLLSPDGVSFAAQQAGVRQEDRSCPCAADQWRLHHQGSPPKPKPSTVASMRPWLLKQPRQV